MLPAPLPSDILRDRLRDTDSAAIMKVGRHLPKLRAVIDDLGMTSRATYIERATLPNEKRMSLADAPEKAPYFSMILIAGSDPYAKR